MRKPRVMIADTDINYIIPLQLKFAKDFFDRIELEIITDGGYFAELFQKPQKADILIVSFELYSSALQKHDISHIFLMTEQQGQGETAELNVSRLFKYTSIQEIFHEIQNRSGECLNIEGMQQKEPKIIVVTSASGGVGKTALSMGLCACLTQNYERVLYVNADRLHTFGTMLENKAAIVSPEVYRELSHSDEQIYGKVKHVIRTEEFSYLPPFKAALMSLGIDSLMYENLLLSAKKSGDFDYIIVDADSVFDLSKARLLEISDKVIVVTEQSRNAVWATNVFVENVSGIRAEKYVFVCNKFQKQKLNALILPDSAVKFTVSHYIEFVAGLDEMGTDGLSGLSSIRQMLFLV